MDASNVKEDILDITRRRIKTVVDANSHGPKK